MCSPPIFGQKGRYIMLEIKNSVNAKQVYGTDGGFRKFKTLTGILPNGNLIGVITTYRDNGKEFEEFRDVNLFYHPALILVLTCLILL